MFTESGSLASQCEGRIIETTFSDRLAHELQRAEARAADIRRAKELLDKNPDMRELMDILARTGVRC